jgi:hypothetical protein
MRRHGRWTFSVGERLDRYEVHLDRKFERMLAMLLRLKDLRQGAIAG